MGAGLDLMTHDDTTDDCGRMLPMSSEQLAPDAPSALGGELFSEPRDGSLPSPAFQPTTPRLASAGISNDALVCQRPCWARAAKRAIDLVLSLVGLILGFPIFIVIAAAVLILDGWPIFFPWDVIGENGRPFRGYKFRTMVLGAHAQRAGLADHNEMNGPVFKMRDDPRVTRLGAMLRRFSLDELPQLWSVLKGDMSLVGPRPLGPEEYAQATPYQRSKLSVTPGITCLWQVMGRSKISDFDAWVALDLKYIAEWSIWLDLKILVRTIPVVLGRKGAW